jgi:hypothetical protein
MQSHDQNPRAAERHTQTLELISALARGDAKVEDVAAQLRKEGFDALDVVLALMSRLSEAKRDRVRARRIDFQQFSKPTPPERVARTVHRVPELPFVLNGTNYDPKDIRRFDGRELHFIATAPGEPIVAIDDREIMAKWWQLTYLSSLSSKSTGGGPRFYDPPAGWAPGRIQTVFYENIWFDGDYLQLDAGYGWPDLTEVHRGFLHSDDWNDTISSLVMFGTSACVLCEDIHYEGSTLSFFGPVPGTGATPEIADLRVWGWNDRTSSMMTWP